jgi:hypothetical protein
VPGLGVRPAHFAGVAGQEDTHGTSGQKKKKLLSVGSGGGGPTSELLGSPDELGGGSHQLLLDDDGSIHEEDGTTQDDEGSTSDDELIQTLELDQPEELPEQLSQQQHPAWWLTAQEPSSRVRPPFSIRSVTVRW